MKLYLLTAGVAVAALSLAACGQKTETQGAATPAEQAATPDANPAATIPSAADEAAAPDFVAKAAASDMYEIQSSKLALKRSSNADVKKFAQQMIDAHTKTTKDLKAAIATSGQSIAPPAALPADLQGKLDDLGKVEAANFDSAYLNEQVDAHQNALNLMQRYAQDGDVAAIKTFAADTAPVIQMHYDKAKALRDAL